MQKLLLHINLKGCFKSKTIISLKIFPGKYFLNIKNINKKLERLIT